MPGTTRQLPPTAKLRIAVPLKTLFFVTSIRGLSRVVRAASAISGRPTPTAPTGRPKKRFCSFCPSVLLQVTIQCAEALYREAIELGLSRGRNAMVIWQNRVADCGFASSYQSGRASHASAIETREFNRFSTPLITFPQTRLKKVTWRTVALC